MNFNFPYPPSIGEREAMRAVIVCHCSGVSDREIRSAVREGARTCREVARACAAGRMCGGCRPAIRRLLEIEQAGEASFGETSASASATAS
jgi:bacterioferritin-associated ferredoxin